MMGISYQKKRQTPKRNVVSSSLAGGAKMTAVSRFSLVYSGFCFKKKRIAKGEFPFNFVVCLLIGFERFTRAC